MTTATVVLAGGRGTRSADPTLAKLAQEIGDASLMAWHLRLLDGAPVDEVIVVAGHLGDQVQALCDELSTPRTPIAVIHEERQQGTVAALRLAAEHTDADAFLVVLGDILMSFRVDDLLAAWRASGRSVAVVVHPSTHPEDSDAAVPERMGPDATGPGRSGGDAGRVRVVPKSAPRDHLPNMSSAGLFAITRAGLARYGGCRDFGSDLLAAAAQAGDLYAHVSSHYLKDTGTPARLAAAQADHASGAFARRGARARRPALFLDRDGVINPALPEVYDPADYTLAPGVAEAIGDANRRGIPVVVVTNQPGIAKGFMTFATHEAIQARMDRLLGQAGAFVDDYLFCPHHPETGFAGEVPELKVACSCRKPATALAHEAAARHHLDLPGSVMVGDTVRDAHFAQAAGMRFVHVADGCAVPGDHACETMPADAIRRGIEVIAC